MSSLVLCSPTEATVRDDVELLQSVLSETTFYGQDELSKALRLAAEKGYGECARVLLENGALPDIHDQQGFTALMIACRQGHTDIVKVLLSHNCNINKAAFGIRATSAHQAASYGHTECLQLLLQAGGNIEVLTVRGTTPLMLASRSGYEDCVEFLLRHGAAVNSTDLGRDTALHYACEEGNTDCATLLCRAGADINKKDTLGNTPLLTAARKGHVGILKLLKRNVKIQMDTIAKEMSLLHWAALGGSTDCVQFLLDHGLEVDIETAKSYVGHDYMVNKALTPLMVAATFGHRELVKLLIEHGADMNKRDDKGHSPLTHAINKSHPDCVLELIKKGAELHEMQTEEMDKVIQIPLFIAIKKSTDCLKVLLRVGVHMEMLRSQKLVSQTADNYITPLELALASSMPGVTCRMLLAAGYKARNIFKPFLFQECMARLIEVDEELFYFISDSVMVCPSLFLLCRDKVRLVLGRKVISCLEELPLPPKLRDAVYLKELDHIEKQRGYITLMI